MNTLKKKKDENYYGLSQSDLLINEILKPCKPFEYNGQNLKILLKYKNPEVSKKKIKI